MSSATHAFLASLVDYAGLFPPAALGVPEAVTEYATHADEAEAWMLGRFIAPAGRLGEIGAAIGAVPAGSGPWPFSVLVGSKESSAAALAVLPAQAGQVVDFVTDLAGRIRVDCLEVPLPLDSTGAMRSFIPELLTALRAAGLGAREVFLELPAGCDDQALIAAIAEAAPGQMDPAHGFSRVGAKLRCGGVTADAFPACERIAGVIQAAARRQLPLKCTAGLHHPVRHRAAEPEVMMHGFLNVFGAGVLAWTDDLAAADILACVAETDPRAFRFAEDSFAWRDHQVTAARVRAARRKFLGGFGSCSFAEPRSDLQDLGIL